MWAVLHQQGQLGSTTGGRKVSSARASQAEKHGWADTASGPQRKRAWRVQCSSRLVIKGLVKWEGGRCYLGYEWDRKLELNPAWDRVFEERLFNSKEVELACVPSTPSSADECMDSGRMVMCITEFHSVLKKNKIKNFAGRWAWRYIPLTPADGRQRLVHLHEFKELCSTTLSQYKQNKKPKLSENEWNLKILYVN